MKRGQSGLSLLVGVNKPSGLSSHDVVNCARRIFAEKRVGHTGTLDPLASGVLPICVGPATRLEPYLMAHRKSYRVSLRLGYETNTDDAEGEFTEAGIVTPDLLEGSFAPSYIKGLAGVHRQVPPQYSAIKINGQKAYERARKGKKTEIPAREIQIYSATLCNRKFNENLGCIEWEAEFCVSKGTYIRSIVRDIGRELGCLAHVSALTRTASGALKLEECFDLETLEHLGVRAALDPLRFLDMRFSYCDAFAGQILNGGKLSPHNLALYLYTKATEDFCNCCSETALRSTSALRDGEDIAVIVENKLKAIYSFKEETGYLHPKTVFSIPVSRL